jgi:hypothetical protein
MWFQLAKFWLTSIRRHEANERFKIVLDRNPLQDIRNSESVHLVVPNGRVLDAKTLNETSEGRSGFLSGANASTDSGHAARLRHGYGEVRRSFSGGGNAQR